MYSHGCLLEGGDALLASTSRVSRVDERGECKASFDTGGPITDMCSVDDKSVFVSSANRPIKMLAKGDLTVKGYYTAYSHVEDIEHPIRMCVGHGLLIGGFDCVVKVWDILRPGRQVRDMKLSTRKGREGLCGLVGALACKDQHVIAAGTYSKQLGLLDTRCSTDGLTIPILEFLLPKAGGVNQLLFLDDGFTLVSGHRQDSFLRFWDTRKADGPIAEHPRSTRSSQCLKIAKVGHSKVAAGDDSGAIHLYSTTGIEATVNLHDGPVCFIDHYGTEGLSASGSWSTACSLRFWDFQLLASIMGKDL